MSFDPVSYAMGKSEGGGGGGVIRPLSVTANGTYSAPTGVDGYSPVSVNVLSQQGFELYGATFNGDTQTLIGHMDNNYLACCFHDNMSSSYTLNGVTKSFTESEAGKGSGVLYGTTVPVADNTPRGPNAILNDGSVVVTSHYDQGSYMSVVGGWVGYPSGGRIYENMTSAATNAITLDSAHPRLLVFLAASHENLSSAVTVDINGVTYGITNMGARYDSVYSVYAAIEIESNIDTVITVTYPVSCYNYVSIIGLD